MSRHNNIVDNLEKKVRDEHPYYDINKFVTYPLGELDLVARGMNELIIYEVKSTDRPKSRMKAWHQLARADKYYQKQGLNIILYYVYGQNQDYKIERKNVRGTIQ
jgi:hypothetical protein